jgi:hypothetical protein
LLVGFSPQIPRCRSGQWAELKAGEDWVSV